MSLNMAQWLSPANKYVKVIYYENKSSWFPGSFICGIGVGEKPTVVVASWGDYKKAGPLLVSLDHRGTGDGTPLRVFLSDVSVKLVGSNAWVNAQ